MSGGGAEASINRLRRVPLYVVWLVLSGVSVAVLRIISPESKPWEYAQTPLYIGLLYIVAQRIRGASERRSIWVPVLIATPVTMAFTLTCKALA